MNKIKTMVNFFKKLKPVLLPVIAFVSISTKAQNYIRTPLNICSEKDIDKIVAKVGNKRIVAIGEDTHGTKEYFEFRRLLTQKLIKEKGFNVFILENPHEDMMAIQEDLYNQPLDTLIRKHLFAIYQTQQMKFFLSWLKNCIKNKKDFTIVGCDDSYREILPEMLKKTMAVYKDNYLNQLTEEFGQRQLSSVEEFYALPGKNKPGSLPDDDKFGYETFVVISKIDSLYQTKKTKSRKGEELIFHAYTNYRIYADIRNKQYVSRDEVMGQRVNFYTRDKNAKIIIWANGAHIAKSPVEGEIGLMGTTIAKQNKGNYINIGLCTAEGSYSYINNRFINDDHNFDDTLFNTSFLPVEKTSWNNVFSHYNMNSFLLDFTKLKKAAAAFFSEMKPFRVLGYRKQANQQSTYYAASPYKLYDLLIFIRKTSHTTALF